MKISAKKDFEKLLNSARLKKTSPRIVILSVLSHTDMPLAVPQIAAKLGVSAPDKVTIYRTCRTLVKKGLVHKAYLHKRSCYFELASRCSESQCHPHFTCLDCGKTHCMPEIILPMAKSANKGFLISHQQVRLEGLCPRCSTK